MTHAQSTLGREIESLAEKYDTLRRKLQDHQLYARIREIERSSAPKELLDIISSYESCVAELKAHQIAMDSIVPAFKHASPKIATVERDFLVLENIVCYDADGNRFLHYPQLFVAKDIERQPDGKQINFTPYNAIATFEQMGMSLPPFPVSCAIVAELFKNKDDAEVRKVLLQYKDKGNGYGWHAQNTVVDWGGTQIIHHPQDHDFPVHGGTNNINAQQSRESEDSLIASTSFQQSRIVLSFERDGLENEPLKKALKKPVAVRYTKNLSGLREPVVLVEVGDFFGKTAYQWVSSSDETRAAWLGCNNSNFVLNAGSNLDVNYAARGVRLGSPRNMSEPSLASSGKSGAP